MKRCFGCFSVIADELTICPYCGKPEVTGPKEPIYLAPGTVVGGRYLLGETVGAGGFGIVYKAWDSKLDTIVAVKEFFASRLMTRAEGQKTVIVTKKSQEEFEYRKERFLAEARNMAKFSTHRSIPNVYEYFEENNTAYIVMELLEGMALNEYMAQDGAKIDPEFALYITEEVAGALESLHKEGIIHRDVAPDNIFICGGKEIRIKLMDLGAAKLSDSSDDVIDIILKPGYSPTEQYDNSKNIGPWTDIYALGATLYMMLTGVKPEESTNRKIEDTVKYPKELAPEIPENISNTVMKAMAVDRHLRFQTVEDFLKALRGKKKIDPVEKEKKRRAARRVFSILAACLVLLAITAGVGWFFEQKNAEAQLKEATISVWFPVEEGSNRATAMASVAADFKEKFPKVTLELTAVPAGEYEARLREAAANGTLPQLFVTDGLADVGEIMDKTLDTGKVLESDQAGECLYMDQYDSYYGDVKKQVPLGFETLMAAVITGGPVYAAYEPDTFTLLSDFAPVKVEDIVYGERDRAIIGKNVSSYTEYLSQDTGRFFNAESNTSAVLLATTMSVNRVREELTGYAKKFVFFDSESVYCRFVYEWSLGPGSPEQQAAAERLLSWMLGSVYQNTLMISEANDGELPLNKTCFDSKTDTRVLAPLKDIYTKFRFEK